MLLVYLIATPLLAAIFLLSLKPSQTRLIERTVQVAAVIGAVLCIDLLMTFKSGMTISPRK